MSPSSATTLSIKASSSMLEAISESTLSKLDSITELSIKPESALISAAETIGRVNKRHMHNPIRINVLLFIKFFLHNKNLINNEKIIHSLNFCH